MALLGRGVVAIWNGIAPGSRDDFYEWHSREHMPERAAVPGFLRGRRLIAERGAPEWFTLYEVDRPETLASPEYLVRLNAPTPWTRRVVPNFTDVTRSLCKVIISTGPGMGGFMATLRCDAAPGKEEQLEEHLSGLAHALSERPGIAGAHLCRLERQASLIPTEEKKSRPGGTLTADFVIMVEASRRVFLDDILGEQLSREALLDTGGIEPIDLGIYRLEFVCEAPT
jgi:hypothetical protein